MATITSNSSGNWATGSTWVGGSVPAADDLVVIAHGHKVTLNTNIQSTRTGDITVDGNLHFATGGKMHLHGQMKVNNTSHNSDNTGEFVEGTAASGSLLSMVNGTEIKISGNNSDQHGIIVFSRKWCGVQIDGGEPTLNTQLNGAHSIGAYYLTVDSATNFAAGDMISLYDDDVDFRNSIDECFYIHDVDTSNNRLYIRQFTPPTAVIQSQSTNKVILDDASVFRIGYKLIFGTGSNRNTLEITNIVKNTVTFNSNITGTVAGLTAYMSGIEKNHIDNRKVKRLANILTTSVTADSTNQITLNNAADFSTGDVLAIEPWDDGTNTYNSTRWRHQILYTVTAKSNNTLTLDRTIPYTTLAYTGIVTKITRDVIIKACASDGSEVADGDEDTARVYFSVRYWTSNGAKAAPTRRIRIKNVYFKNLGGNTNDSTNYRAGVTIGGYNGRYASNVTGSAHDNSTIHNSTAISQTGENYINGCSVTAYNLTCYSGGSGVDYPGLTIRHPYGMVARNNVIVGSARGLWRWSTGYSTKLYGNISLISNLTNIRIEAAYDTYNYMEYLYGRMAENHGLVTNNMYQNSANVFRHLDIQNQNDYAFYFSSTSNSLMIERAFFDRYRYTYVADRCDNIILINSSFMPNKWDGSNAYYNNGTHGLVFPQYVSHKSSSHNDDYRTFGTAGRIVWFDQGYRDGEMVEMGRNLTRIKKKSNKHFHYLISEDNRKHFFDIIFVPANTTVKLRSNVRLGGENGTEYDGTEITNVGGTNLPRLIARPVVGNTFSAGRSYHIDGTNDYGGDIGFVNDDFEDGTFGTSTAAQGKLQAQFMEHVRHSTDAEGAFEAKEITVAAQKESYLLCYGYYFASNGYKEEGMDAMDIEIMMNNVHGGATAKSQNIQRARVKSGDSFTTRKTRISGRF